jgi:hypothetical protein
MRTTMQAGSVAAVAVRRWLALVLEAPLWWRSREHTQN